MTNEKNQVLEFLDKFTKNHEWMPKILEAIKKGLTDGSFEIVDKDTFNEISRYHLPYGEVWRHLIYNLEDLKDRDRVPVMGVHHNNEDIVYCGCFASRENKYWEPPIYVHFIDKRYLKKIPANRKAA